MSGTADVRVRAFSVPLVEPRRTARGEVTERRGFLVRIADGDVTGLGEATPLPGWTESLSTCERRLEAAADALRSDGWDAALAAASGAPAARHAVALARADVAARRAGDPLARHLADDVRERVPVNATVGDAAPAETAARAAAAVSEGVGCVKVKVGARSLDGDLDRLRAVREAVGDDVTLRGDANGGWDRATAAEAFAVLADLEVAYVEQPLPAEDLDGHAALRGGPVGVALDETLAERSVEGVLDAGAADVLVLKPMALGGPDRVRDVAARAREAGLDAVVTTTVDAVVARTGALHVAASLGDVPACGLATADALADDLGPDPAPVVDGQMAVPGGPGLGLDPAEVRAP